MSPSPAATPSILASGPTSATATPSPHRPPTPAETEGSRRNHRKSRRGCGECKRRRIKCDEKRPICGRCALGRRQCPYSLLEPVLPPTSNDGDPESMSCTGPTPSIPTPSPAPEIGVSPADSNQATLLFHFITFGLEMFMADSFPNDTNLNPISFLANESLGCDYLLNQLLAFSARHLAHCNPERRADSLYQARAYQSHGIRLFTESTLHIDESNATQALFFSWLLGTQQLSDISVEGDPESVLPRFLQYLDVYQGVRAVISQAWVYIQQSSLRGFFDEGAEMIDQRGHGPQTGPLEELIKGSLGLDDAQKRGCDEARCQLQAIFDRVDDGGGGILGANKTPEELQKHAAFYIFSWPLVVGAGFLSAVRARRPEALLVIAHFCVILHWSRGYWVVGRTGQDLLEGIVLGLGPGWEKWLQWPLSMMER